MARANRHRLPGHVWHITHRCHKREFLLKFDIDLNMVRAGVVRHPGDWMYGGYHEIQNSKQRYSLINRQKLKALLGIIDNDQLSEYHRNWVEAVLKNGSNQREAKWTESIAVGDKEFVMETKAKLGARAIGRRELANNSGYELKEPLSPYNRVFVFLTPDFILEFTREEFQKWRSQFVTSKSDRMGLRYEPMVFTEQGVAMLSSVLNSKRRRKCGNPANWSDRRFVPLSFRKFLWANYWPIWIAARPVMLGILPIWQARLTKR